PLPWWRDFALDGQLNVQLFLLPAAHFNRTRWAALIVAADGLNCVLAWKQIGRVVAALSLTYHQERQIQFRASYADVCAFDRLSGSVLDDPADRRVLCL